MIRFWILILLGLYSNLSFSQDFDNLMTKKQVDCSDISFNSGLHFIKYINENKVDSAQYLLDYWEARCGMREPVFRARILLALKKNEFNDSMLSRGTLNHIFNYQNRIDMIKNANYYSYDSYKSYYGFIPPGQEFDRYTQAFAEGLKTKYEPETMEYLLAEFYSGNTDEIFLKLQTKSYSESILAQEYENTVEKYVDMSEFHMSLVSGIWIPTGDLKILGNHPQFGFQMGAKHKKMNYDITLIITFLNSPNEYYGRRKKSDKSLELTNHFFGGHIGFDVGRDIYSKNGHEIQLTGGIALDGFDVFEEDEDKGYESESTFTYNLSLGLGYRYYIRDSFYIGLSAKYNFVDYSLSNVIDFTGNPITVQLIVGGVIHALRTNSLKALQYKTRR